MRRLYTGIEQCFITLVRRRRWYPMHDHGCIPYETRCCQIYPRHPLRCGRTVHHVNVV